MSAAASTAFDAADRLRAPGPWEIFGERSRRYEIHLNGRSIEMIRGPILIEGYGLRLFRPRDGGMGIGSQASTELTEAGVRAAARDAEELAKYSAFPAKSIDLPSGKSGTGDGPEVCDPNLWDRPLETLEGFVDALLQPFEGERDVEPSFGSVRATLTETTITNSSGLRVAYPHTTAWLELAVKASGGPEGAAPGEYWVNDTVRRLETRDLPDRVREWSRLARDVRRAKSTPSGELPVVLPSAILPTILPAVIGFRFTGSARLRDLAPELGTTWAAEAVTVRDDGRVPWGIGSSPVDDEGSPQRARPLLDRGQVAGLLYDTRHAGAFETRSTGNGWRGRALIYLDWRRFLGPPVNTTSTLSISAGKDGSDAELIEAAGDGIWLQQLGWAVPDPVSGAFGGEIRIGYRIRDGKLAEPVRGGTLGGTVMAPSGHPSLLRNVAAIGSTPVLSEWVQSPTLLIRPLTVAGQN